MHLNLPRNSGNGEKSCEPTIGGGRALHYSPALDCREVLDSNADPGRLAYTIWDCHRGAGTRRLVFARSPGSRALMEMSSERDPLVTAGSCRRRLAVTSCSKGTGLSGGKRFRQTACLSED